MLGKYAYWSSSCGRGEGIEDMIIFVICGEMYDMSIVKGVFMHNCLSALVCFIHILIEYV